MNKIKLIVLTIITSLYLVGLIYANLGDLVNGVGSDIGNVIYYAFFLLFSVTPTAFLIHAWKKHFKLTDSKKELDK